MARRALCCLAVAALAVVASLGAVVSLGLAPAARASIGGRASIGVGVQADPVRLGGVAHPGGSYSLPSLYVVNTGTQTESISVTVRRLSSGPGRTVPASWIAIGTATRQLIPRQQVLIPLRLVLPGSAAPGSYRSDIVVTGSPGVASGGVRFGAAAATPLEFRLTPGPAAGGWLGIAAWRWWLTVVLVLLAAIAIGVWRTGLRVRIETKSAGGRYA